MTFRHLQIFVEVADSLNMTTASKRLFIAQPSVSQSISDLERHLKTRLFERLGHTLRLTNSGTEFLSYARHLLALSREAEQKMVDLKTEGTLRVGASMNVGITIFYPILTEFKRQNPRCNTSFYIDNTANIEEGLLSDALDIAIIEGELSSDKLNTQTIVEDELLFVCARNHEKARYKVLTPETLINENFIMREQGSGTRALIESVLSFHKIPYTISGVVNSTEAIKLAVKNNLGVSLLSKRSTVEELRRKELSAVPLKKISFIRNFKLTYHKNKFITPSLATFIRLSTSQLSES
jgi:LysR family transcriptional regulator, transcriptional activator of the cysJI operon